MRTRADKLFNTYRQTTVHEPTQQRDHSNNTESQFIDNRVETANLRQLQEATNNSPRVQRLSQLTAMANSNLRSDTLQNLSVMVSNVPRQLALRQLVQKKQNTVSSFPKLKRATEVRRTEKKPTILTPLIQRKAYVGDNFKPPRTPIKSPILELYNDHYVRRFKDQTELESYAANQKLEGIGTLKNGTWVRLPEKMLVLGEDHSKPVAPDIIKATNIKKFRYEAVPLHDAKRLNDSTALNVLVDQGKKNLLEKITTVPLTFTTKSSEHYWRFYR